MKRKTFSQIFEGFAPKIKDPFLDRGSVVKIINGGRAGLTNPGQKNDREGIEILTDLIKVYKKTPNSRCYKK